jgi:peptidoglycan/xylan/chitin deacetylase (PgdA/CDA1 family)
LKRLALTFDDGPSRWTGAVLDLLREHEARATFFLIGQRVRERPDDARRVLAEGHEVGSHTMTHPRLTEIDDEEARREIEDGARAVADVLGERPQLFRAPGFHADERVLAIVKDLKLEAVFADVDPQDWRPGLDSHAIFCRAFVECCEDAIVDLHDGYPPPPTRSRNDCTPTVEALHHLLPALRAEGYELVTVNELDSSRAAPRRPTLQPPDPRSSR